MRTESADDGQTPTTPRPSLHTPNRLAESSLSASVHDHNRTPTRPPTDMSHFEQRSEPADPLNLSERKASLDDRPGTSDSKTDAMDLDDSEDDRDGSDNDTEQAEGDGTKKKRGQRFFCTGFPPCNLSFTRSEHLARHIRKHTGERPFQCHCNRRFSRLDNLRQHAQTVHVNEEIPTDSLAATGTRFQRQIRTDRVRPAARPRTSTMSSTGSHSRGHSRNLSASSVGSTASNYSTATEARRRPPPLLMAGDLGGRPKLGLEPPATPPPQSRGYPTDSPGDLTTPTSATFSATPGSPGFGSAVGSPISTASRLSGLYGARAPARRLSVPSAPSPYHQAQYAYPMSYMNQMAPPSHMSSNSSVYGSPTSSNFSFAPSSYASSGEDPRRRTWHPSTYTGMNFNQYTRPATSGLSYSQTPDGPQTAYTEHTAAFAGQAPRLPGIESFDHVQHRPSTPPRRNASPMQLDHAGSGAYGPGPTVEDQPAPRRGHVSWDVPHLSHYPELDDHGQPKHAAPWSQHPASEMHNAGMRSEQSARHAEMRPPQSFNISHQQQQQIAHEALHMSSSARRSKRHGWYNGPLPATRTSPDTSSSEGVPTPGTSAVEVYPAIMHSNGNIETHHHAIPIDPQQNVGSSPPSIVHQLTFSSPA